MRQSKCTNLIALSFLTVSFLTTSFGGAFATAALAATPEAVNQEVKKENNKGIIAGIAALGLISMLSGHGDDKANTAPQTAGETSSSGSSSSGATAPATVKTNTSADEKRAFDLLNADRAKYGLKALKFNSQLTSLGEKYAQDMINRNFFSHYNPEGQSPFDRMKQAGISYSSAGENLAINNNVTAAEQAFMNSSGHRANILNTSYTEVGIGVRYDKKGSVYVVQEFIGK